jgi:hypothetical protein
MPCYLPPQCPAGPAVTAVTGEHPAVIAGPSADAELLAAMRSIGTTMAIKEARN